ncbi:unnamed protein product [Prunus armeniaca]
MYKCNEKSIIQRESLTLERIGSNRIFLLLRWLFVFREKNKYVPQLKLTFPGMVPVPKKDSSCFAALSNQFLMIPFCMSKLMKIEIGLVGGGGWDLVLRGEWVARERERQSERERDFYF